VPTSVAARSHEVPTLVSLALVLTAVLAVPACNRSEQIMDQALADSSAVSFSTPDGLTLAGRLFGPANATTGVVFAHMVPADQSSWFELADYVAVRGYRALTFDFRGYCPGGDAGCSQGAKDPSVASTDLGAAVTYLRGTGAHTIALVGASMGGTAALVVSASEGAGIMAVVTLSAPEAIDDLRAGPDVLQTATAAKLFIAGNGDSTTAVSAQAFYDEGLQPKDVQILTSNDHGTDLLEGSQSGATRDLIVAWLARFAAP
jgi:pimeloyl-ACP methyl ester carboxylesterase